MRLSETMPSVGQIEQAVPRSSTPRIGRFWPYLLLLLLVAVMVLPFLWMVSTSLKAQEYILQTPPQLIPNPITLDSYTGLAARIDLSRTFFNSLFVAVVGYDCIEIKISLFVSFLLLAFFVSDGGLNLPGFPPLYSPRAFSPMPAGKRLM